MPRRRSPVRTRSRRSARRSPKSRRSARRSPHRSPKRSPKRRSPKRRTGRTFRAVVESVTMKGKTSHANGSGTVSSENRKTIVVTNVSYTNDTRFLQSELVNIENKIGDWKVTEIREDGNEITVEYHVDVEEMERQTSGMLLSTETNEHPELNVNSEWMMRDEDLQRVRPSLGANVSERDTDGGQVTPRMRRPPPSSAQPPAPVALRVMARREDEGGFSSPSRSRIMRTIAVRTVRDRTVRSRFLHERHLTRETPGTWTCSACTRTFGATCTSVPFAFFSHSAPDRWGTPLRCGARSPP